VKKEKSERKSAVFSFLKKERENKKRKIGRKNNG